MKKIKGGIYKIALDAVPAQIYWKDTEGVYLGCNEYMARIFHLDSPKAIIGKTDHDFFLDEEWVQTILAHDKEVICSKKERTFEEIGTSAEKTLAWYLSKKTPIKDSEGEVIGLIGVSIDITQQKKAESVKKEFLANMSHDLRTPFCALLGMSEFLCEKEEDPFKKEYLGYIKESAQVLLKILNQTIEMSAIKNPIAEIKAFEVKELLEELVFMVQPAIKLKDLKLSLECVPLTIKMDRFKLYRIIFSLLANAIQFTSKGFIQIRATCLEGKLSIAIYDTGIGISESQLENIFTEFYKAKPSYENSDYTGLGNGLYIAKQLALHLNGTIHVESVLGEGSIFTLNLPLSL